ncbi:TetR family transcriptional regulator [Dactylosporangium sp. CA-233914]|uniref:TetR family transcriptional regulator n=1 Tax=Dactylosporangium sp. CA-233914 TaxID=3239934 RepID=UPI003D918433
MTADHEDPDGTPEAGPPRESVRGAIVTAAFELFAERGYDEATVADIVSRAGVGRRSFFRYFPTKEAVAFPDHEGTLARMVEYLNASALDPDPIGRACGAARLVMQMYAQDSEFSVRRYQLTRQAPALKAYEKSVVWRYERALAVYLEQRLAAQPDGGIKASAIAAGIVAAHNYGLRLWLRSGAHGDVAAVVDRALDVVRRTWAGGGDPIVIVARPDTPTWRLVQEIEQARGSAVRDALHE